MKPKLETLGLFAYWPPVLPILGAAIDGSEASSIPQAAHTGELFAGFVDIGRQCERNRCREYCCG